MIYLGENRFPWGPLEFLSQRSILPFPAVCTVQYGCGKTSNLCCLLVVIAVSSLVF